jgi:hypothetical protein
MIFFSFKSVVNRKEPELGLEPEPQFVISTPAPGGNLISAPRLGLRNNGANWHQYRTN